MDSGGWFDSYGGSRSCHWCKHRASGDRRPTTRRVVGQRLLHCWQSDETARTEREQQSWQHYVCTLRSGANHGYLRVRCGRLLVSKLRATLYFHVSRCGPARPRPTPDEIDSSCRLASGNWASPTAPCGEC